MRMSLIVVLTTALIGLSCGGDDGGTEADELGIGSQCAGPDDCHDEQQCLSQFAGGYCGEQGCASDDDCPEGADCVAHTDGNNYCFRVCNNKSECNRNYRRRQQEERDAMETHAG